MNDPKVSILIPLYNAEEYLPETIDSCLDQTYDNIEIIIVDDGSTDSSLEIAKTYEKEHNHITVETQNNSGASTARNRAYQLSSGDFIQYLDADDILHPDKIRLQIEVLKNANDRTLVFGRQGRFQKSIENVIWKDLSVNKNYNDPKQFLLELWESGRAIIPYLWLTPRKIIEESGGWDESLSTNDDGEFFARVVFSANQVLFLEKSIGYYRRDNENSLSRQTSKKALKSNLKSFETYIELMKDDMDKFEVRRSLALVYSRFLSNIPPSHKDLRLEAKNKINGLGFQKPLPTMKKYEEFLVKVIGENMMNKTKNIIKSIIKK